MHSPDDKRLLYTLVALADIPGGHRTRDIYPRQFMDIDTVIDDLGGLVDYLSDVPPEEMEAAELADWRRRLEAAADCLHEIESAHCGNSAEDD